MEKTKESLMPCLAAPVERAPFQASSLSQGAASVVASNWGCRHACGGTNNKCYVDCVNYADSQPH